MTLPLNQRLPLYGLLIKEMVLTIGKHPHPKEMVLLLKARPLPSVVPYLRCLKITLHLSGPVDAKEMFDCSIGPGLQALTIHIKAGGYDPQKLSPALIALGLRLQFCGGDLNTLSVMVDKYPTGSKDNNLQSSIQMAWSRAIQFMPKIALLEVPGLGNANDDLIVALSSRPCLSALSFDCPQLSPDVQKRVDQIPFPSLHTLTVLKASLSSIVTLLAVLSGAGVVELDISTTWAPVESALSTELTVLKGFSALRNLTFHWYSVRTDWQSLFRPLLACRHLESLAITCQEPPTYITDDHLLILAQSWPDIVQFNVTDVGEKEDRDTEWVPQATLQGLAHFVRLCPDIYILGLSVNACDTPEDFQVENVVAELTWVHLFWSEADEESIEGIARFVFQVSPSHGVENLIDWHPDSEQGELWGQIFERVEELRKEPPPVRASSPNCL